MAVFQSLPNGVAFPRYTLVSLHTCFTTHLFSLYSLHLPHYTPVFIILTTPAFLHTCFHYTPHTWLPTHLFSLYSLHLPHHTPYTPVFIIITTPVSPHLLHTPVYFLFSYTCLFHTHLSLSLMSPRHTLLCSQHS